MKQPRIGAHVSAAGGVKPLWGRALDLGVEAVQLHPSAPQSYQHTAITEEDRHWLRDQAQSAQLPVYFHSIYLINLANPDDRLWHASISAVAHYLKIAPDFGAVGTITHLGSHKGAGLGQALPRLEQAAEKLAQESGSYLIIENTAGGGGTVGRDLEELKQLYKIFSAHLPTKICLDTCHLFASGVPVHDPAKFSLWLDDFDREIGLDKVAVMHFNDSKTPFNSNRDRHENLGKGEIGAAGLRAVLREPRLSQVDFILEVPGEGAGPDRPNIDLAKQWRG